MSASRVRSNSAVRTGARASTFVTTEIIAALFKITGAYGLKRGELTQVPEVISRGIMVWLSAKQLKSVVLEIVSTSGKLLRKFEMTIDYKAPNDDEEVFQSYIESLDDFLKTDQPGAIGSYRVHCEMNTDDYHDVQGWTTSTLKDDSHLANHNLSNGFVRSKHYDVGITVFR